MPRTKAKSKSSSKGSKGGRDDHLQDTLDRLGLNEEQFAALQLRGFHEDPGQDGKSSVFDPNNTTPNREESRMLSGMVDAAGDSVHYHGTKDRNLDGSTGILSQGLDPNRGGTGAGTLDQETYEECLNKVHLSPVFGRCNEYAEWFEGGTLSGVDEKHDDIAQSSVMRATLPKNLTEQLSKDKDDPMGVTSTAKIDPDYLRDNRPVDVGQGDWEDHETKSVVQMRALLTHLDPKLEDSPLLDDEATVRTLYQSMRTQQHPYSPSGAPVMIDKHRG